MSEWILCGSCNKPIKITELGVIANGNFYHNKLPCVMIYFEKEKETAKKQAEGK